MSDQGTTGLREEVRARYAEAFRCAKSLIVPSAGSAGITATGRGLL